MRYYILILALVAPSALIAQDSTNAACDTASTTLGMRQCASSRLHALERDLDRYLLEARRVAANRAQLDSSQVAWVHYRDLSCRAAGSEFEGGTIKPLVVLECLADLTYDRIRQLYDAHLRTSNTKLREPKA